MAQVYPRIANPYMPQGLPSLTNAPEPIYAPGEIGSAFNDQSTGRSYLRVRTDSGATSATATGAIAANQLAFWKDRSQALVTNNKLQCDASATSNGAVNRVAGVFQLAVTPGNVTDIVISGRAVSVAGDNSGTFGVVAIVDTTASTARVIGAATATTAPISQVVGVISGTPAAGVTPVDVNVGFAGY